MNKRQKNKLLKLAKRNELITVKPFYNFITLGWNAYVEINNVSAIVGSIKDFKRFVKENYNYAESLISDSKLLFDNLKESPFKVVINHEKIGSTCVATHISFLEGDHKKDVSVKKIVNILKKELAKCQDPQELMKLHHLAQQGGLSNKWKLPPLPKVEKVQQLGSREKTEKKSRALTWDEEDRIIMNRMMCSATP